MISRDDALRRAGAELSCTVSGGARAGGGAPWIVLTHGAAMDRTVFDAQVRALVAAGYRTLTWDLRGHGRSRVDPGIRLTARDMLEDLAELLAHVGVERPVLVGHSLGGNLSQELVRRCPARARGLVVLDAAWNAGPLTRTERLLLRASGPLLRLVPPSQLPDLMARASAITPDGIARTRAVMAAMPRATFLEVWAAVTDLVRPDPTSRTPVPLALLRGERDATGNIATSMPRWAQVEQVRERVIPDAGHVVMLDAPDTTSRALLEALDGML